MKTLILSPEAFMLKWPLKRLESLNENALLVPESMLWKSAKWPLLSEFFIAATYRRRLVAVSSVREYVVEGVKSLFVHCLCSLRKRLWLEAS